ncbi:transposase [Mesorhizobium sp. M0046]|uniref:transposase n=1 Tax=Mesorhizobium sp. M0046 TaxID=2956858 RepID=UPI00333C4A4C
MIEARRSIIERVKLLDTRVRAVAKQNAMARLFMTAPGVGAVIALTVASTYDDASRFRRSSSAGAYLGLTPGATNSGSSSLIDPTPQRPPLHLAVGSFSSCPVLVAHHLSASGFCVGAVHAACPVRQVSWIAAPSGMYRTMRRGPWKTASVPSG